MTNTTNTVNTPVDVNEIFNALQKWINQRPGLDFQDYGDMKPYREELRSIAADKRRALKALDEARGLNPQRPELLIDSFQRAFSGRLQWTIVGEHTTPHYGLSYTAGQYWPTEYRKAAASVLESYVSAWRQAYAAENPQTFTYHSIEDVKAANRSIGGHWFDRSTMRFFNTKIESGLIGRQYFITSDRCEEDMPKRYTVRKADDDGSIDTIGHLQQYLTVEDAREAIRELLKR